MYKNCSFRVFGIIALLCASQGSQAQTAFDIEFSNRVEKALMKIEAEVGVDREALRTPVREIDPDLAVPEAPAFTALGVTPETVIRPTSAKQFSAGILQGADPNGNLQTGLAIETSPYLLLGDGNTRTIGEYRRDPFRRILARTGLSLATTKGLGDDEAIRFAAGLTLTPWDRGDPKAEGDDENDERDDLALCLANRMKPLSLAFDKVQQRFFANFQTRQLPEQSEIDQAVREEIPSDLPKQIQRCHDDFREANWNATAWNLGIAPTFLSPSGSADELEWAGLALYTTFAYGFEEVDILKDDAQLLLHARYRLDEQFSDSDTATDFFEQDTLTLGAQLRVAGPSITNFNTTGGPDLNFLAETAYIMEDRDGRPDEEFLRYSIGAEIRLTDNLYLKASFGAEDGRESSDDETFALFNVKYNLSAKPTIGR